MTEPLPVLPHSVEQKRHWADVPAEPELPITFFYEIKCHCGQYFRGSGATLVTARATSRKMHDEHVQEVVDPSELPDS